MKLIVGLGNPGKEYTKTRHNVGFMVIDELITQENLNLSTKTKFKGALSQATIGNESVILLKPLTYMNLSGESVLAVKNFYNIDINDILVIYDDLDLPVGKIRIKQKGSSGGHKGMKSIIACLNSSDFPRLKIGIDKEELIPVTQYVLTKFSKAQKKLIDEAIEKSINAVHDWIKHGVNYAMNNYN